MRNRGRDGEIQASTYQYHPRHLLYHENPEQGWHAGVLEDAHKRLKQHIPKHLQASFKLLWHGCPREQEDSTLPAARWINTHGTRLGFRVPNAGERARATGRGGYLSSLKLTEAQLYDLVGNHFDPDALILRIGPLLRAWARGACPPSITTPSPPYLLHIYRQVRAQVIGLGVPAPHDSPFPSNIHSLLLACDIHTQPAADAARLNLAAEDGRGGM